MNIEIEDELKKSGEVDVSPAKLDKKSGEKKEMKKKKLLLRDTIEEEEGEIQFVFSICFILCFVIFINNCNYFISRWIKNNICVNLFSFKTCHICVDRSKIKGVKLEGLKM